MEIFSVRCHFRMRRRNPERTKKYVYEERITLWNATTQDEAIELAEREAAEYCDDGDEYLGYATSFVTYEEWTLPSQGIEIFSLLRDSDLEPDEYLSEFFFTGDEYAGE